MAALIVDFRNFANVPSKPKLREGGIYIRCSRRVEKIGIKEEVRETFAWREKSIFLLRPLVLVTEIGLN
jgi:hypothetical protein